LIGRGVFPIKPIASADFVFRLEQNNIGFHLNVEKLTVLIIIAARLSKTKLCMHGFIIQFFIGLREPKTGLTMVNGKE